ncbi:MAG: hypothetical protein A2315_00980 [Ignavibacteria bacterium RIFOXYB2_FULL_35_12]|nr:MAG: hypothetical protein A2058_16505 [Ignavibacteria bacterium GWA2_36_19]OGU49627.1 MAG: hypothetical protein A2006_02600 [Ignavibacteria bacterium GWC2_35_8]OGU62215.1 MAG: hypothetical protein A2X60_04190 [Ignavibacteria bacterium GWF2_35_20]OGU84621.1 MAG: hypothetical protein A3K31_09320 [Ignavibacteria bacterium RIFOXYA12_FULL_35_25]OGU96891.1 MAG: hypothetical protein A2347_14685 [Ignavibacteria bacterium RIFOXYB12_FULL_35_14]OGV00597.1 MAG: hypothetical protein A2455_10350 [Ignavib
MNLSENKLGINNLFKKFKENLLSYLYLLKSEFQEVNVLINELKNYEPFKLDVREATPTHNALNIAVVISYARNFKRSYGFNNIEEINTQLRKDFTDEENKLHKRIITERDKEFAHSDASANDIQIYYREFFSHSRKTVRQLLEKNELLMLQKMVSKIRTEIDNQIKYINN